MRMVLSPFMLMVILIIQVVNFMFFRIDPERQPPVVALILLCVG
jgi:hypothetical protein